MSSSAARVTWSSSSLSLSLSSPPPLERRIIDWLSQVEAALQPTTTAGHEFENFSTATPSCQRHPARTQKYGENPYASPSPVPRSRKRRASGTPICNKDPISPPLTTVGARDSDTHDRDKMYRTPSPKKRKVDIGNADPDITPRAA
jgi:hypothetical protein